MIKIMAISALEESFKIAKLIDKNMNSFVIGEK